MNIQDIISGQVVRAYVGKPGCMCGCKGKYYDHSSPASTKMLVKILRTIQANEEVSKADGNWVEAHVGGKDFVVYLSE